MEARPCQIIEFFNGARQLLVPLFQRPYEWTSSHWETLWSDLLERYERSSDDGGTHFTGAIVTAPAKSIPVGVSKHLIIDGQQRLTTFAILLCSLRSHLPPDSPKSRKLTKFLINEDDVGTDYYKLQPTQWDRTAFYALVNGSPIEGRINDAFKYFRTRIAGKDSEGVEIDLDRLFDTIHTQVTVVSIHLSDTDDPYLIFESLNAKGAALTQADLIRNYVLLRLHSQAQQHAYETYWMPMQTLLTTEHLTEFMRQYLMLNGEEVGKSAIYAVLKKRLLAIPDGSVSSELERMHSYSQMYATIVGLSSDVDPEIERGLRRLRRWEVNVATPFVLRLLGLRRLKTLTSSDVATAIRMIESYVVRRMICGVPTNQMKRIFLSLAKDIPNDDLVNNLRATLARGTLGRRWPKNDEFLFNWIANRAYSAPLDRCKLILESLEEAFEHKEVVDCRVASIEHVMPQTLSLEWKSALGPEADSINEKWGDTIGNLTLTAYNPELSNSAFAKKQELFRTSHFEMSRAIAEAELWNDAAISGRAIKLFELAKQIWPRPSE